MSKEAVVGIATHAHSVVDFDIHFNHCNVISQWVKEHKIKLFGYKGLCAAEAREMICRTAIELDCSHIFFLDADHIIPLETLDFLLESKDEAIVSGVICRKFYPFDQVVWGKNDKTGEYLGVELDLNGKIYEVGVCGFGCTLINLEKLQELDKPWFRDTCDKKKDGKYRNVRSDVQLCDAFRANGEKVWVDTRILVGHTGMNLLIYPQNAEAMRNFKYQYEQSIKLSEGQVGMYKTTSRLL